MSTNSCASIDLVHEGVLQRFSAFIQSARLAHAYLFIGPPGSGKTETAVALAKMINCAQHPPLGFFCNQCASCRKIAAGNHPDVVLMAAEEDSQTIKIEAVRDLISRSQLKPFEADYKIFIVQQAHDLSLEASNALLKTLEEPSDRTIIILTTTAPEKILATIRSRCQMVPFPALPQAQVLTKLQQSCGIDVQQAQILIHFTQGRLGRAVELQQEGFFDRKNEMIDNMVLQKGNGAYLKRILSDEDKIREALLLLLSWFRDVLALKSGAQDTQVVHQDRRLELSQLEFQYTFQQLEDIIDQITKTMKMLTENLNVKLSFTLLQEKIWARL